MVNRKTDHMTRVSAYFKATINDYEYLYGKS